MEDQELTKYQLERKISEVINKDNGCTAHFIWEYNPYIHNNTGTTGWLELKVVTINPSHSNHFLLHKVKKIIPDNNTNVNALYCKILKEVIKTIESNTDTTIYHYAIGWRDRTKQAVKFTTITSYFSGRTFKEIIEKFFFEKCENDIIIDSITLLPDT